MLYHAAIFVLATLTFDSPTLVKGHGFLKTPRSRNWFAHDVIENHKEDCPTRPIGCPEPEYCQHCLNVNTGVCGKSPTREYENADWRDQNGSPMPWISQVGGNAADQSADYVEGGNITIDSYLDTHHNGHMEIRACVIDDNSSTKCTLPSDFEGNELEFLEDHSNHEYNMPADPEYPERGMYSGGQGGGIQDFSFEYRLPIGIYGEKILLQWKYITANSCSPPGYDDYFLKKHPDLPSEFWTAGLSVCTLPYPPDGDTALSTNPEQFFNCAEISILPGFTAAPTISPKPTDSPTTYEPTTSQLPSSSPVSKSPTTSPEEELSLAPRQPGCYDEWADCTNFDYCCVGLKCVQVDTYGYSRCLVDTCDSNGTTVPTTPTTDMTPTLFPSTGPFSGPTTNNVTSNPTKYPTTYPTNPTGPTNPNPPNIGGCCTINLKTCNHPEGTFCDDALHCENECGKIWLPDGELQGCTALWEGPCSSDADCCQHGECMNGRCDSKDPWKKGITGTQAPTTPPTPDATQAPTTAYPTSTSSPSLPVPTSPPTSPVPTATPTNSPTIEQTTLFPTLNPTTPPSHGDAFDNDYSTKVRVNQVGYLRFATKIGIIVDGYTSPREFQIQDAASGDVVLAGTTMVYGADGASGDHVHQADFSSLTALGRYSLVVDGIGASLSFNIASSLYPNLPHEAMNYFYFHRMGNLTIERQHLIDDRYAREALHPQDTAVPPYNGWCSDCEDFDLSGSWADAGDFGVYTVNHAISAWTLMNLNEMFPEAFADGELNLPESNNSIPDVLDEVDFGSRFVRGMLPSDGGLASHKAHNHEWSAFTITIEGENAYVGARSAMGPSSPATYAVARVNAQLARMWSAKGGDAGHVTTLWNAAKDAWERAQERAGSDLGHKIYDANEASPGPATGGGDYPDGEVNDDQYAAACEMYLTAYALSDANVTSYRSSVEGSSYFTKMSQWDWASVSGAGTLSLYAVNNDLDEADKTSIETSIVEFANKIKMAFYWEGYPSNLNFPSEFSKYPWGSNSFIMNRMIALAYAFEITGDVDYQKYLLRSMDYIMGTNAMDISYVTGYGEKGETDTHDRWAWTIGNINFWPKGWLSGGPNNELINDYSTPNGVPAAKSYAGFGTAPQAWGSKENTVNWNAPLAWAAWYIENKIVPNLGGEENLSPQKSPTDAPTDQPTNNPTMAPSNEPSAFPTKAPMTPSPTSSTPTTPSPSSSPTHSPTNDPTTQPTKNPTETPSNVPTTWSMHPTLLPITPAPTLNPTSDGTVCCVELDDTGYKCKNSDYCNANEFQCGYCRGTWMSVPVS